MNITRTARTRRPGFTLIEVLVAAGLCMLIMVVMTQAFAAVFAALDSCDPRRVVEIPADREFQAGLKILLRSPAKFFGDL